MTRRLALLTPLAPLLAPLTRLLPKAKLPGRIKIAWHWTPHSRSGFANRSTLIEQTTTRVSELMRTEAYWYRYSPVARRWVLTDKGSHVLPRVFQFKRPMIEAWVAGAPPSTLSRTR